MSTPAQGDASRDQLQRLGVLIATSCIDMIGFAMVLPLMPYYALKLAATPEQIGFLIASFSIAQLLISPVWGAVSDRYGRRPALLIGLGASAIAYVVFGFANSLWLLFASRIIQGAGGGTTGVAQAYVADTIKPSDRARALGWLSAASSLGVSLGPVIGSFAAHWGQEAPGLVAAVLCLLNMIFAWRWLPESRPAGLTVPPRRPIWHAALTILQHPGRPVSRLILIYGAGMLGFSAMTSILPLFLNARFGVTEKTIGYFFLYVGALSFVMRSVVLGPVVARIGEMGAMRVGTMTLMLGLFVYPLPRTLWLLAAIIPLIPIGTALLFPATTSLMSRATPQEELGVTMGVAQTFAGLARVIAPLVATVAYQRIGIGSPFIVAGIIVALVGVLAYRIAAPPRLASEET
ncbi:MAG: multidrug resistance protein [Gemmatimonadetes bacterium]|nr:multidrug resistance protein [Gemmatimonadota bacterium]